MAFSSRLLVVLAVAGASCRPAPAEPPAARAAPSTSRQLGSWNGDGNTTLGFVSESGSFRINWTVQNKDNARPGAFLLTLRSGISGRELKVIADHHSAGGGSVEFGDDPRLYELLVESKGINWSISAEETMTTRRK
jgi:hypothetical protein